MFHTIRDNMIAYKDYTLYISINQIFRHTGRVSILSRRFGRESFFADMTSTLRPVRFLACSAGLAHVAVDRNIRGVALMW